MVLFIPLITGLLLASGCVSTPDTVSPVATAPVAKEPRPQYIVGVDGDYPPFTFRDSAGNFTGIDIEAARWIADRQGFDVEFVAVPWDAIIPALKEGSIDMVYSGMTITPEREAEVDFTRPYLSVTMSLAVRTGSPVTTDDLYAGRLKVGAQAGSTGAEWVESNLVKAGKMPAGQLVLYPDTSALTGGLVNGSIDISISDMPVQEQTISGRPLRILAEVAHEQHYAVAVRKTDPHILVMMDEGLQHLMADPFWEELMRKYGISIRDTSADG